MARWRIGEHLKARDWEAVVIDLLIVILGVFLGIQVSNWNQDRQDRADGRRYVERIRDDLVHDVQSLDQHERYWRDIASAGERALAHVEEGDNRDPWALINDFYGAGQNWSFSANDSTYEELRSAGRLNLIANGELRGKLADYHVSRADEPRYLAESRPEYRLHIRAVVPYRMQQVLVERCQRGFVRLFTGSCPQPQTRLTAAAVLKEITSDKQLIGELRTYMTNLAYMRTIGQDRRKRALSLIADIDSLSR